MKNSQWFLVIAAALVLATGIIMADPAADGAALFKAKCVMCHGADGSGDTTMGKKLAVRDLRSEDVQKQTDEQLMDIVSKGKNKMPAYGEKVSADELKLLVAHLRTLKK